MHLERHGLDWAKIKQFRWLQTERTNREPHQLGFSSEGLLFASHQLAPTAVVALEAKLIETRDRCACQLLALWLDSKWGAVISSITPEIENPKLQRIRMMFSPPNDDEHVYHRRFVGQSLDVELFRCFLEKQEPSVCPEIFKKKSKVYSAR